MVSTRDMLVRRNTRIDIALPARLAIADAHAQQVRFGPLTGALHGWIDADVVDVSAGGVGMISPVFVPRRTLVRVEILDGRNAAGEAMLKCVARVQRVIMTDRRPAYFLGAAFEETNHDSDVALEAFLERLGSADD